MSDLNRPLNIIEAMQTVFKRFFPGGSWKPAWAFLSAIFAVPMNGELAEIARKFTCRDDLGRGEQFKRVFAIVGSCSLPRG